MLPSGLFYFTKREVRKLKIKKVDDKPMVIHSKQKAKLHTHEPKHAAIKGSNVYTVDRDPIKKKADNGKYRKSTVHQVQKEGMFSKYRKQMKQAGQSIKVKDSSLRNAGTVGSKVMTDQIEGGQEIQQSAMIMYEASKPVTGTASRGAELFKRQVINQQKRKIKKVETGKKIAKKGVKGTAKKVAKESSKKVAKESAKTVAKETSKVVAKTATTAATTAAGTAVSPGVGTVIGIATGEVVGEAVAYKMDKQDIWNISPQNVMSSMIWELMKKVPMLIRLLRSMKNIGRILKLRIWDAQWELFIVIRKTVTMMKPNLRSLKGIPYSEI